MSSSSQWEQMLHFLETGGALMVPLLALGVMLWYALAMRWFALQSGWSGTMGALVTRDELDGEGVLVQATLRARELLERKPSRQLLRGLFSIIRRRLDTYARLISAITLAAPMLGLLGTVIGMAETFDALATASQIEQAERIAAGISQALITTEFGLFLSIPGVLLGRALDRRAARLDHKLDELEALMWSQRGAQA